MASHLKVLMRKNFLLWKRSMCGSLMEILLPSLLCCFFYLFRSSSEQIEIAEKSFLEQNYQGKKPELTPYVFHSKYPNYPSNLPDNLKDYPYQYHLNFAPWIKNCINGTNEGSVRSQGQSYRNGKIALAPKNYYTEELEKIFNQHYFDGEMYQVRYFNTGEDIQAYVRSDGYGEDLCLGLSMQQEGDSSNNNEFKYSMHFNVTSPNPKRHEIPETKFTDYKGYLEQNKENYFDSWVESGFIQIQTWMDNIIMKKLVNDQDASIDFEATSERNAKHNEDPLIDTLKGTMANYYVLPMILTFLRMSYALLNEKEKKIKEGMKIMGLSDVSFYLSWLLHYFIVYLVTAFLVALVSTTSIWPNSSFTLVWVWYLMYGCTLLFQSLLITTFFSKAKIGIIIAMVFYLFLQMSSLSLGENDERSKKVTFSFFTQTGVQLAADTFLLSESKGSGGITWSTINKEIENYTIADCMIMMIVNMLVFGFLAFYFDQVFPNEFGKKKHPLFCFPCLMKNKKVQSVQKFQNEDEQDKENITVAQNIEQVDQILKDKEQKNEVLSIQNVTKVYSNGKKAVDNLSFNMYKDQITCLLGHNGAGKTSTIQMLIGMQEFSKGKGTACGLDIEYQMDELRKIMGVCPQHDVLYDNLTCQEHLELYAAFKGVEQKDVAEQVEKLLRDVDLLDKRHEFSRALSGGMKRRLSVAIAFIGNSKLVYLDEPTSGMDTSARRHIWEMLQKYKQDKIVVLTTHFMDEADFLGDRIAIMGEGKLICLGSSQFLKNQFGIGYNLTIVKKDTTVNSKQIKDYIQGIIPKAKQVSDISAELQFQLNMNDISKFQQLFEGLDNSTEQLNIANYGISITTMEEVFLRVADEGSNALVDNKQELLSQKSLQKSLQGQESMIGPNDADNFDLNSVRVVDPIKLFFMHFIALSIKRIRYFKRDWKGFICEICLPCLIVLIGLLLAQVEAVTPSPTNILKPDLYENKPYTLWSASQITNDMKEFVGYIDEFNFKEYVAQGSTQKDLINDFDLQNFKQSENEDNRGAFFIKSIDKTAKQLDYLLEIDTTNRDALPIFVNRLNTGFIRQLLGSDKFDIEVKVDIFHPTKGIENIEGVIDGVQAAFIFSMALAFIPASMITFTVKEREDQIKHQQLVSGVSLPAYWLSNLAIDLLKYYIPVCVFSILMISAFNIETFTETSEAYWASALLFIMYGWAIIPFSYILGFMFKKYGNAQVLSFFLHFMFGGVITIVFFVLRLIPSTADVAKVLIWFVRLIPSFSFGMGILNLGSRKLFAVIEDKDEDYLPFDISITGGDIIFMGVSGLVYFLAVFLIEQQSSLGTISRLISKESNCPYKPKPMDSDVKQEADLVESKRPEDYTVRVNKLRKVYKSYDRYIEAVDQVSFGIDNGECFTLLGINGAGKTTTFKILSGDLRATSGQAHIKGYDINTNMKNARNFIGYCPQFDALLENLTSQEHLELYAAIKGIPSHLTKELIDQKIDDMELTKFRNVCAGTYSGGNKRKLSVAIAMLGNPPICFLDEPSTGMDPKARRYMWNVISRISTRRKQSSIILTTHSMEEAEALSTKIAIMVTGQLKCIGSIQHIKSKFGKGYEVEIKINIPQEEQIQALLSDKGIPQDEIISSQKNNLQQVLDKINMPDLCQISQGGSGEILYNLVHQPSGLKAHTLAEYIIIEEQGQKIKNFIQEQFGQYSIIEHFSTFYRFKIETQVSTARLFGSFEQHKQELNLASYNVKQATIEQIFNMFAKNQIPTITSEEEKNPVVIQQDSVKQKDQPQIVGQSVQPVSNGQNLQVQDVSKQESDPIEQTIQNSKQGGNSSDSNINGDQEEKIITTPKEIQIQQRGDNYN